MNRTRRSPLLVALCVGLLAAFSLACVGGSGGGGSLLGVAPSTASGLPDAPGLVSASSGDGRAAIAWESVSGANSYTLYFGTGPTPDPASDSRITAVSSPYTLAGLKNGVAYSVAVAAVNASGEGPLSAPALVTPVAPVVSPPGAPAIDSLTAGDSAITITWTAVPGVDRYSLYWGTAPGVSPASASRISGVNSPYLMTGLTNSATYSYVLTAENSAGESAPSAEVSGTPQAAADPLPAPTLFASAVGDGSVQLAWDASPKATSYDLFHSTDPALTEFNGTLIANVATPYTVAGLANGVAHYFIVQARSATETSEVSNTVSATPLALPDQPVLDAPAAGDGSATLTWSAASGATAYDLYSSTDSAITPATGTKTTGVVSPFVAAGLANGVPTYFVLVGRNAAGQSPPSATVSATPQPAPAPPPAPVLDPAAAGVGSVTLTWSAVASATTYDLYYKAGTGVSVVVDSRIAGVAGPYTVSGLSAGTPYSFVLTAGNAAGSSGPSPEVSATPIVLAAPVLDSAAAVDASVSLAWHGGSGAASYNVYYDVKPGVTVAGGSRIAGVISPHTVAALTNGTAYYFVVTAAYAQGESAPSNELSATPQPAALPPQAPVLDAPVAGQTSVALSWSAVADALSYNLYYSTDPLITIATGLKVPGVAGPHTQNGLTGGTTYYFILTAVNAQGQSAPSGVVSATPTGVPPPAVQELKLAHFNIRIFSNGSRDDAELAKIAAVCVDYDFLSIVEVRDETVVQRLIAQLSLLGRSYGYIISAPVGGTQKERYAFVYDTTAVAPLGDEHLWVDTAGEFFREPYIAGFRAGSFDFTMIAIHVIWGSTVGGRRAEINALAGVYQSVQDADPLENDVILAGDFNRNPDDNLAWDPIMALANMTMLVDGVPATEKTMILDTNAYDNILSQSNNTTEFTGVWGIDRFDETDFNNDDNAANLAVSDHRPVWMTFSVSGPDDD